MEEKYGSWSKPTAKFGNTSYRGNSEGVRQCQPIFQIALWHGYGRDITSAPLKI
ncbi:MAG: hypothetical protein R2788_00730 [Saprospiraceae bacterium]